MDSAGDSKPSKLSTRKSARAFLLCLGLAWLVAPTTVHAYPAYVGSVLNGSTYKCITCHNSQYGGYPADGIYNLNPFGLAFQSNSYTWNSTLWLMDSDGDGYNNYTELNNARLPGFGKSGVNFYFTCYNAPSALYGELASTFSSYTLALSGSATGTPCAASAQTYNNAPQFELNECSIGIDTCDNAPVATCTNTVGIYPSFTCTCPGGYSPSGSPSGQVCTNINECVAGTDVCDDIPVATCMDTPGAYTCTCPSGYTPGGSPSGQTCTNINECATANLCDPGYPSNTIAGDVCVDTAGSYSCTCPLGYAFNGTRCVISDACVINPNACDSHATCTPSGMTFSCSACNAGWTGSGAPGTCVDINECNANNGGCSANATCTNTPGSRTCGCNTGYSGNGITCTDVNECNTNNGGCSVNATCMNSPGTFSCTCVSGYAGDGFTCDDIDECIAGTDGCDAHAICKNTPGSRTCTCASGYSGNGITCTEVDECALGTDDCAPIGGVCTNSPPGYFTCTCATGYAGVGTICVDINDCTANSCPGNEICVNQLGAPHSCVCADGYVRPTPSDTCQSACGNGRRVPGEDCDDGNLATGDGCSATCLIESGFACFEATSTSASVCMQTCGDQLIDPPAETCDDGASNSDTLANACRTNCKVAHCGDGVVDANEGCDEGTNNSDTLPGSCRTNCRVPYCGDGVIDPANGEVCEPGGGSPVASTVCEDPACEPILPDGGVADGSVDGGGPHRRAKGGCGACAVEPEDASTPPAMGWLSVCMMLTLGLRRRRARRGAIRVGAREILP